MNLVSNLSKWIKTKLIQLPAENEYITEYKIIVVGEKEVGKTSFVNRFISNEFNLEIKPTTQSECYSKQIYFFEEKIKIEIIDINSNMMGSEHSYLYKDVKGAVVLYDITKRKSFDKVESWVVDMRQNIGSKAPILIVGNKMDLHFLQCVHEIELSEKANNLNCDYMETTCTDNCSVDKAIKFLVGKIYYFDLPPNKQNYLINYLN